MAGRAAEVGVLEAEGWDREIVGTAAVDGVAWSVAGREVEVVVPVVPEIVGPVLPSPLRREMRRETLSSASAMICRSEALGDGRSSIVLLGMEGRRRSVSTRPCHTCVMTVGGSFGTDGWETMKEQGE